VFGRVPEACGAFLALLPRRRPRVKQSESGGRSQGVRRGAHLLGAPGEVRLLAMEGPRDGINQHVSGGAGLETTRFFEGQHLFHPLIALGAGCL